MSHGTPDSGDLALKARASSGFLYVRPEIISGLRSASGNGCSKTKKGAVAAPQA